MAAHRLGPPIGLEADMPQDHLTAYNTAGNAYRIHIHRSTINAGDLSDPHKQIEGLASYRLTNGGAVNRRDEETFEIVATGELLKVARD